MAQSEQRNQSSVHPQQGTKSSPAPDPGQAIESGEPTLTGTPTDKAKPESSSAEAREGKHWESGEKQ